MERWLLLRWSEGGLRCSLDDDPVVSGVLVFELLLQRLDRSLTGEVARNDFVFSALLERFKPLRILEL